MKLFRLYKVLLFVLVGFASFLPMARIALGFYDGDGGGP